MKVHGFESHPNPAGGIMQFMHTPTSNHQCAMLGYQLNNQSKRSLALPNMDLTDIGFNSNWLGLLLQTTDGDASIKLHQLSNGQNQLQLNWPKSQDLKQRFEQDYWLCFDSKGRLFTMEFNSSVVMGMSV